MALVYGLRRGYRAIRAVEKILESVTENSKHVQVALAELAEIRKEVKPNGGSSLRDAVNRIDRDVRELKEQHAHHYQRALLEATSDHSRHAGAAWRPSGAHSARSESDT